jgi:hypothetical protein
LDLKRAQLSAKVKLIPTQTVEHLDVELRRASTSRHSLTGRSSTEEIVRKASLAPFEQRFTLRGMPRVAS